MGKLRPYSAPLTEVLEPEVMNQVLWAYLPKWCGTMLGTCAVFKWMGSVLGPTLWNVAYDSVLRVPIPGSSRFVCSADDTVLLSLGRDLSEAIANAERDLDVLVSAIEELNLEVTSHKTEAMAFPASALRRRRNVPAPAIFVRGSRVVIGPRVKYLGVVLDSSFTFRPHFAALIPKAKGILRSLGRLLPNLHGPGEKKRRLYSSVIQSVLIYGAPVWTVSFYAAMMVSGIIALDHLAPQLAEVYATLNDAEGPFPLVIKAALGADARRMAVAA
ncbi:hypothetical protein M0804_014602 [Polistes exclamans]|nr:hypothetical protein M0804_014602 [Polistes exclamans]